MKIVNTKLKEVNFLQFLTNDKEEYFLLINLFKNAEIETEYFYCDIEYKYQVRIFNIDLYDEILNIQQVF